MAKKKRSWPPLGEPLPVPVTDNHTHLPTHEGEIPSPEGVRLSLEQQIGRANEARVNRLITSACSLPDCEPTLQIAREWPEVKVAMAIHPNEAALHAGVVETSPDGYTHDRQEHHIPLVVALEQIAEQLHDPEIVAVGETGLDYFRTGEAGQEAQKESFVAHLEMARIANLPVQIHDRDAHADTVKILKENAHPDQQIVFHCFSGDKHLAQEITKHGWFASFAGPLTYPDNESLREAFLEIPRNRILVETDAPYLTPVPYRGCPNASYLMPYTVRFMAELWNMPVEEAIRELNSTTAGVYGSW